MTNREAKRSFPFFYVHPASLCPLPTSLIYEFRLSEMRGAGRTHNCCTSQFLLMKKRRKEETRERHPGHSLVLVALHLSLPICLSVALHDKAPKGIPSLTPASLL